MKLSLTVLLLFTVTSWAKSANPKFLKDVGSRIINGEKATPGQFPWQVAVYLTQGEETHFCGGTLITDEWVLTAGHCVSGADSFTILLGITNLDDTSNPSAVIIQATESVLHENFSVSPNIQNDIGLVHLSRRVTLTDNIQTITLSEEELDYGVNVTVSGWGKTSDASTVVSPDLNFVHLVTIDNYDCNRAYVNDDIGDDIVCADFTSQTEVQSTCNGDSGGPLVINADSDPVHVAIVSFVSDSGCESGFPSGYTRTGYFIDWIREKTGLEKKL